MVDLLYLSLWLIGGEVNFSMIFERESICTRNAAPSRTAMFLRLPEMEPLSVKQRQILKFETLNLWNINLNINSSVSGLLQHNMKLLWTLTRTSNSQKHRSINYRLWLHPVKCKNGYTVATTRESHESITGHRKESGVYWSTFYFALR